MAKSLKEIMEERQRIMDAADEERPVVDTNKAKLLQDSFRKATSTPPEDDENKKFKSKFEQLTEYLRGKSK